MRASTPLLGCNAMKVLGGLALSAAVGGGAYTAYKYSETNKVNRCKNALRVGLMGFRPFSSVPKHPQLEAGVLLRHDPAVLVQARGGYDVSNMLKRVAVEGAKGTGNTASGPRPGVYINCEQPRYGSLREPFDVPMFRSFAACIDYPIGLLGLAAARSMDASSGFFRRLLNFLIPVPPSVTDMVRVLGIAVAELTQEGHSPLILLDKFDDLTRSATSSVNTAFKNGLIDLATRTSVFATASPTFVFGTSGSLWSYQALEDPTLRGFHQVMLPDATPAQLHALADREYGRPVSDAEFKMLYDIFGTDVLSWITTCRYSRLTSIKTRLESIIDMRIFYYMSVVFDVLKGKVYGARGLRVLQTMVDSADGSVPFSAIADPEVLEMLCQRELLTADWSGVQFRSPIAAEVVRNRVKRSVLARCRLLLWPRTHVQHGHTDSAVLFSAGAADY